MPDPSFSVDFNATGVTVQVFDERSPAQTVPGELADGLARAIQQTLEGEGVVAGSVDLIVVDVEHISKLNTEHMGSDGPTDVLSFPLDDPSEGASFGFTPHVGDIVLCWEIASAQAAGHAGSLEAELLLLVVHSALHLLGHDHADDVGRAAMQSLEKRYLTPFGFDHPGDQS